MEQRHPLSVSPALRFVALLVAAAGWFSIYILGSEILGSFGQIKLSRIALFISILVFSVMMSVAVVAGRVPDWLFRVFQRLGLPF